LESASSRERKGTGESREVEEKAKDRITTLKGSAPGKIIFIAGASQGIGRATAVAFAQAGARAICITASSEKALSGNENTSEKGESGDAV
jgi:hypothetical protein